MGQQGGRFPPRTPCTGTPAAPVSQQTHLLFRIVILAGNTNDLGNQAPRQPSLFTLRFPLFSLTSTIFRGTQMKPGTIHLLLGDMHPQQPRSQVFSPCTWNSEPHFKEMLSTFLADRGGHRGSAWTASKNTESLMYVLIFTLPVAVCPGPGHFCGLLLYWGQCHSTLDIAYTSLSAGRNVERQTGKGSLGCGFVNICPFMWENTVQNILMLRPVFPF